MRPPKPPNVTPSPRTRRKKGAPSSTPAGKPSLKKLGREISTIEEFNQIDQDVLTAHDRAVAILLASQVERFLEMAVISHLFLQDDSTIELLVARDGPLASFHSKIILAYAMGFIASTEKDDLDKIRQIRNAFAHTLRPITFKTEQIASLINGMHAAKGASTVEAPEGSSLATILAGYIADNPHRMRFVDACRKLSLQMLNAARRS